MKLYKLGVSNSTYNKNDGSMRWNENEEEKVKREGERHPFLFVNFGYGECERGTHHLLLWDGTVVVVVVVVDVIFLSLPPSISHFFFIQVLVSKSSKDSCLLLSSYVPNHTLPFPLLFWIIIIITLTSRSLVFTFRQQVRSVFLLFGQDC
jgi:hypothetical protein